MTFWPQTSSFSFERDFNIQNQTLQNPIHTHNTSYSPLPTFKKHTHRGEKKHFWRNVCDAQLT